MRGREAEPLVKVKNEEGPWGWGGGIAEIGKLQNMKEDDSTECGCEG